MTIFHTQLFVVSADADDEYGFQDDLTEDMFLELDRIEETALMSTIHHADGAHTFGIYTYTSHKIVSTHSVVLFIEPSGGTSTIVSCGTGTCGSTTELGMDQDNEGGGIAPDSQHSPSLQQLREASKASETREPSLSTCLCYTNILIGPFFTTHDTRHMLDEESDTDSDGMESSNEDDLPRNFTGVRVEDQGKGTYSAFCECFSSFR